MQSLLPVQVEAHEPVALLQAYGAQIWRAPFTQVPAPSQKAALVASPPKQLAALHIVAEGAGWKPQKPLRHAACKHELAPPPGQSAADVHEDCVGAQLPLTIV
ncbi:MAG: hypothetical protein A3G27_14490 [Betaproteobacteria bacterium RIFCSPLOWO2_12_FULL_66_14]|nr:MAG: hypothetical protein A3G27_14490 [Betaproteobacteria bacterium RIFCSPLOWO2_12_FULL_66_14]